MSIIEQLKRLKSESENRLRQLESGSFQIGERLSGGELIDRTKEQAALVRSKIRELESVIQQAEAAG